MINWKEYKLGEIAEISTGFPFKGNRYSDYGVRVVRGENVTIGNLRWDTIKCWNDDFDQFEKYSLKAGDVVIGMDGSRVGKNRAQIRKTDLPLLLAQRVALVRAKIGFSQDLVAYLIKSNRFERYVEMIHTGTSIPHISQKQIEDYTVVLPDDLPTQTAIAEILSSLDDKIELNNKINQELENLAQTLFKQWFIDFEFPNENGEPYKSSGGEMIDSELGEIPKGWKVKEIGLVAKLGAGGDKPKIVSDVPTEEINVPIYSNGITNDGLYGYTDKAKIFEESVTISARGTIGFVCLRTTPYVPIVRLISASADEQHITTKYLYMWLRNQNIYGNGTTQQQLTVPDFKTSKIIIPVLSLVDEYTIQMNAIIDNINFNKLENQELIHLRDTLLPKLISGELEVSEALTQNTA
jgi:type I restriction enzyme S subunit